MVPVPVCAVDVAFHYHVKGSLISVSLGPTCLGSWGQNTASSQMVDPPQLFGNF